MSAAADERLQAIRSLKPAPDSRRLTEATERVCGQTPVLCQAEGGSAVVMERIEQKARNYIDEARGATGTVLRALTALVSGLARMPGRKTMVLMSDGFFAEESLPAVQQIAGQAARNGVAIYGLDGRGLAGSGTREMPDVTTEGPGLSRAFDTSGTGPEMLARGTGGFVVRNASHFAGALSGIARDTSSYYVLGYSPANSALDGSFRKIEVKAKGRDGLEVRARKGYLATPLPPPAQPRGGVQGSPQLPRSS